MVRTSVAAYAVASTGAVVRLPCRPRSDGIWHWCTCRPSPKVGDPTRALHAGDDPDVVAGTIPRPRRGP